MDLGDFRFLVGGGEREFLREKQTNYITYKKEGRGLALVLPFATGMGLSKIIILIGLQLLPLTRKDYSGSSLLKVWSANPGKGPNTVFSY